MGNTMIAYGNYVDSSVLSGGSWQGTLPLENLKNRQLGRLARTTGDDTGSTLFVANLGSPKVVQVLGILNHNLSSSAQYRIRGSDDSSFTTVAYDTGWKQVWPSVYDLNSLEWESNNFWLGGYDTDEVAGYPWHLIELLTSTQNLQFWRFEFDDVNNPQGYVQIGRLFVGQAWQPASGIAFGCSIGWEDPTGIQVALSSAEYFDSKAPYRVAKITTHFMETDEAMGRAFEIIRQSGSWKEIIYVHDVDDTTHAVRRRFPGRIRTVDQIANPYPDAFETSWDIKELTP